jgi:predicted  nucleic acid-binding Zn-ribbon protein
MNFSQQVLRDLKELHRLEGRRQLPEAERSCSSSDTKEIEELRKRIPTSILGHYDRLRLRGKVGVAPVHNDVCGACHLHIPKGVVVHLQGSHEMGVCDNCGAFIYVPQSDAVETQISPKAKKSPSRRQKATAERAV